jgi:hypothetical protein
MNASVVPVQTPTASDSHSGGREQSSNMSRRIPPPKLSPPPPISPEGEERARNAAAARDVSRELDSLSFSPSDLSPLAPPAAPFGAKRSVSPRPPVTTEFHLPPSERISPTSDPATTSPTVQFPSPERYAASAPAPSINSQAPGRTMQHSSPLSTPYRSPNPNTGVAPPQMTKSNAPLNPPPTSGARTISAAAFKRPKVAANLGGPDSNMEGLADTSPLVFKKKPLPSSPYPQRGVDGSGPPGGNRAINADPQAYNLPPQDRLSLNFDGDDFDYISAYVNDSPNDQDTGEYGQMKPPGSPPSQSSGQGYGQGRFATNLDEGLR